jgi:putative transposase
MARLARIAVPELPYHVTQRGNRRQPVFLREEDYRTYLALLHQESIRWQLRVWAYCLMTNHVHLIVWPATDESLSRAIAETHRRYTRHVNFREGWRGYLWQGRFGRVPLDEAHLVAAMRYVERNPVEAGLVERAADYPWSSARAHVLGISDPLLRTCFLTDQITNWAECLASSDEPATTQRLEVQVRTGRPHGPETFLDQLEQAVGYRIRRLPVGRPPRK